MKHLKIKDLTVKELLFDICDPDESCYANQYLQEHYNNMHKAKGKLTKDQKEDFKKFLNVTVGVMEEKDYKYLKDQADKK